MEQSQSKNEAIVRHATREDVHLIDSLIRELADYERELSSVECTPDLLLKTLDFYPFDSTSSSGRVRPARCLLLYSLDSTSNNNEDDGKSSDERKECAGFALYYHTYSTWRALPGIYLEDLFIRPAHRRHGYGRLLISELARMVVQMEGGRLEWSVLRWNEPSIKFYEGLGAGIMEEWVGMRVEGGRLGELAGVRGVGEKGQER